MRKFFSRQVRILGRSFSVASLLAAIIVLSVAAWSVFAIVTAWTTTTISVADAPQEPMLEFNTHICTVTGGTGSVVSVWDAPSQSLTCDFSDFSDTTVANLMLAIKNVEPVLSIDVSTSLPASTPCVDLAWVGVPIFSLGPGIGTVYQMGIEGIPGPAGTITCAGTTLPSITLDFDIALVP